MDFMKTGILLLMLVSFAAVGFAVDGTQVQKQGSQIGEANISETDEEVIVLNDGGDEETGGYGIAVQVREVIQERKNGTIEVPQGQLVRIIAQNRVVTAGNESIPLSEQLRVQLNIKNRTHVLGFNSTEEDEVEIEDSGVKVRTRENITLSDDEISVGKNKSKVLIMPSVVPEKIQLRTMESAVLHVVDDTPVYDVNGTRGAKVLWLFDAEMPVQARINAQNGDVIGEDKPWWGVFVTSEES